jgi:hypothetical protein
MQDQYIMLNGIIPHPQWTQYNCNLAYNVNSTKIYGPKVFLVTKIKPKYSDILWNSTHFPGPMVCRIRQVQLYMYLFARHFRIYKQGK